MLNTQPQTLLMTNLAMQPSMFFTTENDLGHMFSESAWHSQCIHALASIAAGQLLDLSTEVIFDGLKDFGGTDRRFPV